MQVYGFDALEDRVRQAITAAEMTVVRSEILTAASRLAKDETRMIRRCAWCGCLQLGRWTPSDEAPAFLSAQMDGRATHGICPACLRRLKRKGESGPLSSR